MDWPTIHPSSILDEIQSIQCMSDFVIQDDQSDIAMDKEKVQKLSQIVNYYNHLNSLSDAIPSMKSLIVLRRYQLLKQTNSLEVVNGDKQENVIENKDTTEIMSLVERSTFNTNVSDIMPNCEDIQVMIQKRIRDCHHDISNYIEVIQSLKDQQPFSLHIKTTEFNTIPIPSSIQIEKDITRESLIINGVSLDGSQGLKSIRHIIQSCIHKEDSTSIDWILQKICRTRVGEYCYNELNHLLPIEEGTLLLVVDNMKNQPIEVQVSSKIFKKNELLCWGICLNCSFKFSYQVIRINDITNQKDEVAKIQIQCQVWACHGLEEFDGEDVDDMGYLVISIE